MPQILGSSMILPLILVLVILLGSFTILVLRRKAAASTGAKTKAAAVAQAPKPARESRKEAAQAKKAAAQAKKEAAQAEKAAAKAEKAAAKADKAAARANKDTEAVPEVAGIDLTAPAETEMPPAVVPSWTDEVLAVPAAAEVPGAAEVPAAVAAAAVTAPEPAEPVAVAAPAEVAPQVEVPVLPAASEAAGGRFGRGKPAKKEAPVGHPVGTTSADPLQMVIASILQGWGDIGAEDTNRLALFRKDKVCTALAAVELPKESKSNEYAKTRLTQLRRYANSMEQPTHAAAGAPMEHEFAGMIVGPSAAAVAATAPVEPAAPEPAATRPTFTYGLEEGAPPAPSLQTAPPAADAAAPAAEHAPDLSHAFAVPKDVEDSWDLTSKWTDVEVKPHTKESWEFEGDTTAAEERAAEFDWGSDDKAASHASADVKAAEFSWNVTPPPAAEPESSPQPAGSEPAGEQPSGDVLATAGWTVPSAEPVAAPAAEEAAPAAEEAATTPEPLKPATADEAHRSAEAAVAAAAAAFWSTPEASTLEDAALPADNARVAAGPFSRLGANVSTAAEVMALPAVERADMLAFLKPAELSKVFAQAEDRELKKSVIDTLEHIGNTTSLDAIRACLEDLDPEIQLHALEAADRMLGSGS